MQTLVETKTVQIIIESEDQKENHDSVSPLKLTYLFDACEVSKDSLFGMSILMEVNVIVAAEVSTFSINDILQGFLNVTRIIIRGFHRSFEIDITGIESLHLLTRLCFADCKNAILDSLQGIEFCTNLEELILVGIDSRQGGISLAPLSSLELKELNISRSRPLNLNLIKTNILTIDMEQIPLVIEAAESPSFKITELNFYVRTREDMRSNENHRYPEPLERLIQQFEDRDDKIIIGCIPLY